jgi:hypothetical protein
MTAAKAKKELPAAYQKLVKLARSKGACAPALKWLREKRRTAEELVREHPEWAHWAADAGIVIPISPAAQERLAGDADASVRGYLARNPAVTPAAQERLAGDADASVRWCLASNPAVTPALQERLAGDANASVRGYLASNPAVTPAAQERLAGDANASVRGCLAINPAVTESIRGKASR